MQMAGLRGYAGWRWIFIMEGIVSRTLLARVISLYLSTDLLHHSHHRSGPPG